MKFIVEEIKQKELPEEVFDVFNKLIAKHWNGYNATIFQEEAVNKLIEVLHCTKDYIYENHLLDVEGSYEEAGWTVCYDKPGFNESYKPIFKFSKKD